MKEANWMGCTVISDMRLVGSSTGFMECSDDDFTDELKKVLELQIKDRKELLPIVHQIVPRKSANINVEGVLIEITSYIVVIHLYD